MNAILHLLGPAAAGNATEAAGTTPRGGSDSAFGLLLRQAPLAPPALPDSPPFGAAPGLPPPPVEEVPAAGAAAPSAPAAEAFLALLALLPEGLPAQGEGTDAEFDALDSFDTAPESDAALHAPTPAAWAPAAPVPLPAEPAPSALATAVATAAAAPAANARPTPESLVPATGHDEAAALRSTPASLAAQAEGGALARQQAAHAESFAHAASTVADAGNAPSAPATAAAFAPASPAAPSVPATMAAPAAATPELTAPLASMQWGRDLGQQMAGVLRRGDTQVALRLNPAELGPLLVELKLSEQQAQMHFASPHAAVRQAVEQAIPQLREALAEQGISLGEAEVGEHGRGGDGREAAAGHGFAAGGAAQPSAAEAADTPATGAAPLPPHGGGQVNLYV